MSGMRVYFSGLGTFSKEIEVKKLAAVEASRVVLREMASVVERQAKTNATSRPGPNVLTGALRSSITRSKVRPATRGVWFIEVGPTVPYGRRIELGFSGPDSIGRVYHQPPYPFLGPAVHYLESVAATVILNKIFSKAIDA